MEQFVKRILVIQAVLLFAAGALALPVSAKKMDTSVNNKAISSKVLLTERLVSFQANYFNHSVDLHWDINAINYSNHFDIERSTDGVQFEKVGEAKQDQASKNRYFFEDEFKASLARKNDLYYRLKQTDANRETVYSKVLIVRSFNTRSVEAISVTPDPSVNDIEVNVQLKQSSFIVMKVTDRQGNEIIRKSLEADGGDNKYALAGTSRLAPGDYNLEIIVNSNERMSLHLIKS